MAYLKNNKFKIEPENKRCCSEVKRKLEEDREEQLLEWVANTIVENALKECKEEIKSTESNSEN